MPTMMLLLVDDNPEFRRVLRKFLDEDLHEIHERANGAEAVDAFDEYLPDWVLMDLEMPVMDGLAATQTILATHPKARIVIVTQHDDDHLRTAARKAGAHAYLVKDDLLGLRAILAKSPALRGYCA